MSDKKTLIDKENWRVDYSNIEEKVNPIIKDVVEKHSTSFEELLAVEHILHGIVTYHILSKMIDVDIIHHHQTKQT
jgi:hypothetical protein